MVQPIVEQRQGTGPTPSNASVIHTAHQLPPLTGEYEDAAYPFWNPASMFFYILRPSSTHANKMRSFANLINLSPRDRTKEVLRFLSVRYRDGSEIMLHSMTCSQWFVLCCGGVVSDVRGTHPATRSQRGECAPVDGPPVAARTAIARVSQSQIVGSKGVCHCPARTQRRGSVSSYGGETVDKPNGSRSQGGYVPNYDPA